MATHAWILILYETDAVLSFLKFLTVEFVLMKQQYEIYD